MKKIQVTGLFCLIIFLAFSEANLNPISNKNDFDNCFQSCNSQYETIIGQVQNNLTVHFENQYENQVYPMELSFTIRMMYVNGEYKDLKAANENNPSNSVENSNCGDGWYDVTMEADNGAGGINVVSIEMCQTEGEINSKVSDNSKEKCDAIGYTIEIRNVTLYFRKGRGICSSDTDYYYQSNKLRNESQEIVIISPNPISDYINIEVSEEEQFANLDIMIFNSTGIVTYQSKLKQTGNKIDVRNFMQGFYLVKIFNLGNEISTQKLILH